MHPYVLLAAAPSKVGLVEVLLHWLHGHGAVPAADVRVIADLDQRMTFARIEFGCLKDLNELKTDLRRISGTWPLDVWHLQSRQRPRVLVLAGRKDHRIHGLLALHQQGRLDGDIVAVASRYQPLQELVDVYNVHFNHLGWPSDPHEVVAPHGELMRLVRQTEAGLVVLTQSMQILSNQVITQKSQGAEGFWQVPTHDVSVDARLGEVTALRTAVRWHALGELLRWSGHTVHLAP